MSDTTGANEEAAEYPSFGPACESCKRPDVSNMKWQDGVKNFFSIYFASPRMGPIGYILGSPYSPFRLERQIPYKNWRDRFEDLLAIDAGRGMISEEDRKVELAARMKNRYESTSESIEMLNGMVRDNLKFESTVLDLRNDAAKAGRLEAVKILEEELAKLTSSRERSISDAQQDKAGFESIKNSTASNIKARGYWLASLTTSGALPGWFSVTRASLEGDVTTLSRFNAPPELQANIEVSEYELAQIFEQGQPHSFSTTTPLPQNELNALANGSLKPEYHDKANSFLKYFEPSPSSILA